MRFQVPTLLAIGLAIGQTAQATILRGIILPSTITPGNEFNVTYMSTDSSSNAELFPALYGITSGKPDDYFNESVGGVPFAQYNLSNVVEFARNFNVTLLAPSSWSSYGDGNVVTISSASIEQVGQSGGIQLDLFHANTTIKC